MDPSGPGRRSKRKRKPAPSSVSLKSDPSKGWLPPDLEEPPPDGQSSYNIDPTGISPWSEPGPKPAPSSQLKSDFVKDFPSDFREPHPEDRSDHSKDWYPDFREPLPEDQREPGPKEQLDAIFTCLEEDILKFVKEQLQRLHNLLVSEYPESSSESVEEQSSREAVLNITLDFLRRMKQEQLAERLSARNSVRVCRDKLKSHLQQRFSCVFEGVAKAGNSAPLHQIYTELYITEGGASEVNQEHEVRHIETASRKPAATETSITCEDLFKGPAHRQQPIRDVITEEEPVTPETTKRKRSIQKELTKRKKSKRIDQRMESIIPELPEDGQIRADLKEEGPIRTVLTKGVAGVGKTVLTQKLSLDWAEGRAHQDVQLLFPFTFRELNVLRDTEYSLVELLQHFFSQTKGLCSFQQLQVLFIFDGLDECRLPLDFSRTRVLTEPTESASVEELLVNLIRGSLLPSARLWLTTRPAAANQIPAECVSMVTEVRGFTDSQKEQYFRKRFRDEQQATEVISHIKSIHSLYIMCHIPVFCWILSTVLLHLMETRERGELPRTLTQMYVHLLVVQAKVKNIKYHEGSGTDLHWTPETWEMVRSLGKLAFDQLQKGNLIFYESDLSECGLDAAAASVYSGVFTQVFREEPGLYQDKVYCFIHLTVQEFLAALHVHQTFFSSGENLLSTPHSSESPDPEENLLPKPQSSESPDPEENMLSTPHSSERPDPEENLLPKPHSSESPDPEENLLSKPHSSESPDPEENLLSTPHSSESPEAFYRSAVDQALQSPNGHLDLFLRFLLGLSLSTNQRLLPGQLTHTGSDSTNQETVKYLKEKLNEEGLSAERSLNLLHCLNELNDRSLMEQIQSVMRKGRLSLLSSPAEWSALSFLLLSSDSDLEEFDLRKYQRSETALLKLLPLVKVSTKAILRDCGLSPLSCAPLASVLSSSSLTHLDLSNNDLQDSGVELLCSGLKSTPCRLHTLSLSGCLISERGGASLTSALSSAPSHLRLLDLSYNHPGPSAKLLTALRAPQGPLHSLRLDPAGEQWMVPGLRKYSCEFSLDPNTAQRNLLLSLGKRTVTAVEKEQYPHHEDRFMDQPQVLSSKSLRKRCYWEVQWSGRRGGWVDIAVSYRRIRLRGHSEESEFGNNDQSWSLRICGGWYYVRHNKRQTDLSSSSSSTDSGVVGVFLDSEAGALSFYEVRSGGDLSHIYTFTSSFTEPLFPGFGLWSEGSSVSVVDLRRAPPGGPL